MRHRPGIQKNSKPSRAPSIHEMAEMLKKSKLSLNQLQLDQLWRYHNLIRKRNTDNELTRIKGFEPMVIKHYVDSMIVGNFLSLPTPLVDVGTGAGFPGVPLKIRYPHLKLILAEPRPKRVTFLNEVIRELRLSQTHVFDHKVVSASFTKPVNGVISRAVEHIEKTILRTSAALQKDGLLIFLKGPAVDPEIVQANKRFEGRYKLVMDKAYTLPNTPHDRRLVVYQRLDAPDLTKPSENLAEESEDSPPSEDAL